MVQDTTGLYIISQIRRGQTWQRIMKSPAGFSSDRHPRQVKGFNISGSLIVKEATLKTH